MKKIEINEHVLKLKESATLAINLKAKELANEGKTVYHWGFGQSPFPISDGIQAELKKRSGHKEYLPTLGLLELRQTISEYYSRTYHYKADPENIFIGPGSKELIFQLLYLLKGQFIIPAPSWVSYGPQIDLKGEKASYLQTKKENNYKMLPEELDNHLSTLGKGQKSIILNSPSNPTGQVYSEAELANIAKVLKKHEVIVISDEIYGQVNFTTQYSPSLSQFYPEGTIITGGLSKAHSAGGYRLGYMIIPEELTEIISPLKSMISETFSAVAAPIQYAAIKAWDGDKEIEKQVQLSTAIHKACGEYFHHRLHQMKLHTAKPQGAFYLFVSFAEYREQFKSKNILTSQQLCDYLLENVQIALLPGDDFYYPEESLTTRLAFVDYDGESVLKAAQNSSAIDHHFVETNCPHMKEGLDKLENFIQSLISTK